MVVFLVLPDALVYARGRCNYGIVPTHVNVCTRWARWDENPKYLGSLEQEAVSQLLPRISQSCLETIPFRRERTVAEVIDTLRQDMAQASQVHFHRCVSALWDEQEKSKREKTHSSWGLSCLAFL